MSFNLRSASFISISLLTLTSCQREQTSTIDEIAKLENNESFINPRDSVVKNDQLNYIISYNMNGFEALVEYDIKFNDQSSTNGVVQKISGPFNTELESEKLKTRGSSRIENGGFIYNEASEYTYWVSGKIQFPETESIREDNKKALHVNVITNIERTISKK